MEYLPLEMMHHILGYVTHESEIFGTMVVRRVSHTWNDYVELRQTYTRRRMPNLITTAIKDGNITLARWILEEEKKHEVCRGYDCGLCVSLVRYESFRIIRLVLVELKTHTPIRMLRYLWFQALEQQNLLVLDWLLQYHPIDTNTICSLIYHPEYTSIDVCAWMIMRGLPQANERCRELVLGRYLHLDSPVHYFSALAQFNQPMSKKRVLQIVEYQALGTFKSLWTGSLDIFTDSTIYTAILETGNQTMLEAFNQMLEEHEMFTFQEAPEDVMSS
jgi:hypothetical protein